MELEGGCFVPVSHTLNHDGYFRKSWGNARTGDRHTEFFHRTIYRLHNNIDAIPQGFEIDHKCRNRACANPSHLRLIDKKTHRELTNKQRKSDCDAVGVHYGAGNRKRAA